MKRIIKFIFRAMGLSVSRLNQPQQQEVEPRVTKSVRTKRLTLHETATGNYYLPTDAINDEIALAIKNNIIFDEEIHDIAKKYIVPGSTVLDLGANFGQMSIMFSNLVGDKGHVHSFEADDWVYEIFTKNIEANNKQGIIVPHFGAVHHSDGEILYFPVQDFERYQTYGSHGIDYTTKEGREVPSLTVDSINIQEPISFMKIDIEGGDLNALRGAVNTINKNRMPIIFEYQYVFEDKYNMCFQDYIDFVESINYKFVKVISAANYLILPK